MVNMFKSKCRRKQQQENTQLHAEEATPYYKNWEMKRKNQALTLPKIAAMGGQWSQQRMCRLTPSGPQP